MKKLVAISFLFLSFQLIAQDTIVHKSGKVEAVQILSLNTDSKLMIYTIANDTVYSSTNNFEKYMLHSDLETSIVSTPPSDQVANSEEKIFTRKKKTFPRYDYGKFSVSTNIAALAPVFPTNLRVTLEPEYQFTDKFSVKVPIMVGVKRVVELGDRTPVNSDMHRGFTTYGVSQWADYDIYPNIAVVNMTARNNHSDIVFQVGLNPKYYFNNKSKNPISLYVGASLNLGIMDSQRWDYYQTMDTAVLSEGTLGELTYWDLSIDRIEISKNEFFFFNYEAQFGLEFNFSKRFNIGTEVLYASKTIGQGKLNDRIFAKKFDDLDYTLALEKEANLERGYIPLRFRLFVTYRFGGKLRK